MGILYAVQDGDSGPAAQQTPERPLKASYTPQGIQHHDVLPDRPPPASAPSPSPKGSWHLVVCSGAIRWIDPAGVSDSYAGVPNRTVTVRAGCGKTAAGNISGRPEWREMPYSLESSSLPAALLAPPPGGEGHPAFSSVWLHSQRKSFPSSVFCHPLARAGATCSQGGARVPGTRNPRFRQQKGDSLTYKNRRMPLPPVPDHG